MKLIIKRDQKAHTGLLGGHKGVTFFLNIRVEVTPQEQELMKRYNLEDIPLVVNSTDKTYTIIDLMRGVSQEHHSNKLLFEIEKEIKESCRDFKYTLEVKATFGGEEVVEY